MPLPAVTVLPDSLFLPADRGQPLPLYLQIAQRLEVAIRAGQIPAGSRIENELSLADRLGLSRQTVRRALQELVDKGLLVRRRGIGTHVVRGQISRSVELTSLYEDLEQARQAPSQRVLSHEVTVAPGEVAARLGLPPGSEVLKVRRLRYADAAPLAILENYLAAPFTDLNVGALEQHGLYQLLQARGITFAVANQRMSARQGTAEEVDLLQLPRHAALLSMERTAFDNSGRAVEYGSHVYRPDRYAFEVTLVGR